MSASATKGRLTRHHGTWPCVIGKNGLRTRKREGDLSTPIGQWPVLGVYYRADRVPRPQTLLPIHTIREDDGWCDAIHDRNYNRRVTLPYPASCESLWRADHVYDIIVVLNYNIKPRIKGLGSAVFFHLTRPDHSPTEGCIAVDYPDMLQILKHLGNNSIITIL